MNLRTLAACTAVAVVVGAAPCRADWEAGLAAYNRGDFEAAASEIKNYVANNPTDPRYAIAYYLLGSSYLQTGRTEEGIANLRSAVALDPQKPDYRLALGQGLLKAGEIAEASTVLEALATMEVTEEQRVTATLLRSRAALELGDSAKAVALLEAQLETADDSADLHRALGLAYYRSGSPERAFSELSRAYDLDPGVGATGRNAVIIALDVAGKQTSDEAEVAWHQKAYTVAERLATTDPSPSNLAMAGRAAQGAGLDEAAAAWLEKASAAQPDDPRMAYDLGRTLVALGEYQRALTVLDGALAAGPDADLAARIHRQIAKIHARNLDLAKAAFHFQRAGDERAARQIGELVGRYQEAIESRNDLAAKIAELRSMEAELAALNDSQGVAVVRERADAMQSELDALEENLEAVRRALDNL
jgi:tetratricopeptide (TPR) repeat protein